MSERHILSGKIAATTKHYGPDAPQLEDLKRNLAAVQIADYVSKIVATAPELTETQRAKIASLLRSTNGPETAA